jgi:hypothetical protein
MGKLPGYDSNKQMDTSPANVQRDMGVAAQTGKNIAAMGKVASDLANAWQEAEDFQQTLSKQNHLDDGTRALLKKQAEDPEYRRSGQITSDLETLKSESLDGFSNNLARDKFSLTANAQTTAAQIKADGIARSGLLKDTEATIYKAFEGARNSYIKDGDQESKNKITGIIQASLAKGTFDPLKAAKLEADMNKWDSMRYLKVAEDGDADGARKMVRDSDMDPTQKVSAYNMISAVEKENNAKIDRENKKMDLNAAVDIHKIVRDDKIPFIDRLEEVQKLEEAGFTTQAEKAKKYLYSEDRYKASTNKSVVTDLGVKIGTLQGGITKMTSTKKRSKDRAAYAERATEYLERASAIRQDIMDAATAGQITSIDEEVLIKDFDKTVAKSHVTAVDALTQEDRWFNYDNKEAFEDLEMLLGNKILAEEAFVEYFYQINDKDYDNEGRKAVMRDVANKIKENDFQQTTQSLSDAKNRETKPITDEQILNKFTKEERIYYMKENNWTEQELIIEMRKRVK